MTERPVLIATDLYAIYNDERREVYFEKHLSASSRTSAKRPAWYKVPGDYRVLDRSPFWPAANTKWVV